MIIGHYLCIYSRIYLGLSFKGRIQIDKSSHGLITDGPFSYIRHPIYTGFGISAIGAIINTKFYWISVLCATIHCYIFGCYKLEIEEVLLSNVYGKAWHKFKQKTPAKLVPLLY